MIFGLSTAEILSAAQLIRSYIFQKFSGLSFPPDKLHEKSSKQDIIAYATSIKDIYPSFSADLIQAVNRTE